MRSEHKGFLLAGLLLGWSAVSAGSASDAGGTADDGEQLVARFLHDVDTLQSRFEQSLIDAEGRMVEVTSGSLYIDRPGRFRWAYTEPYEQVLIADGLNMWSYDVDLAQVTVKPQAEALSNTPAMLLGGSADALAQFEYRGSIERDGVVWVTLEPAETESGFLSVELGFSDGQLDRMLFRDNLDQTTVVALYDVQRNEPIPESYFRFKAPDDADVIGVPAVAETASP